MAKLLRAAVQKGHVAIGLGDFNMVPSSLAHRIISTHGRVADSWLSAHPLTPAAPPPAASARFNIETMGATCDTVLNTWRMPGPTLPPPDAADSPHAKRLDYVFHSPRNSAVRAARVTMTEPMPMPAQTGGKGGAGRNCSLSDHFALEVQLLLAPSLAQQRALAAATSHPAAALPAVASPPPPPPPPLVDLAGPGRAREGEGEGDGTGVGEGDRYLPQSVIDEIFAVLHEYMAREVGEKKWRIAHFFASIPVLVGLHVAAWWSPHYAVNFVLVLLAWIVAVTGTLDGLVGFVFTGSGSVPVPRPRAGQGRAKRS